MAASTRHRKRRVVIGAIVCLALAGGVAAVLAARKPATKVAGEAPSIFKTATVKLGDLTTTESVDGTVQLSSTLTILHRIEGQTSSSVVPANSSTTPSRSTGTTASSVPATASAALISCPTAPAPAPPAAPAPPTTVPVDTATTVPVDTATTTPSSTTTSSTSTSTTSTTPTTSTTSTTTPQSTTTVAATPPPTTTTVPCEAPTTTLPTPDTTAPAPGGGSRPSGGGGSTGTSRSGSGTTSAGASTTRITQTITSIIAAKSALQHGDVLYTVDGSPVVALDGALPAWRSLSTASTDGADIAQLEASLVALGYDPAQKVTVDNHFDSATKTMVKAWQTGLGLKATGTVTLGTVVFLPTSATVSAVARQVGDQVSDGDTVMTLATPTQQVLIDVPAGDEAKVVPGLQVTVGQVAGTVSQLRSANRNGSVVVEALVTPATAIAGAGNGTAVKVTITLPDNTGVLIAPAAALVSRLDGTYAVQQKAADGSTKWVTVELLGISGGNVALRGADLSEGAVLLVPA